MLGIIDLDTGNLGSLYSALKKLNLNFKVCKTSFDLEKIEKIILPGVGAFGDFMKKMNESELQIKLQDKIQSNMPILGLCVGFQVLFSESNEHQNTKGLNLLNGKIKCFKDYLSEIKTPHVGWNECSFSKENNLFHGIENNSDFYFTHSYAMVKADKDIIISTTKYEIEFISSVNFKNIYGVQFHPEKSQLNGLKLLKNFNENC